MEEDGDKEEGASWLHSPACLLCVRKQLWPTEDYITYRDTYAPACTYTHVWMHMDIHSLRCRSSALSSGASSSHSLFPHHDLSGGLREGSPSRSGLDRGFKSPVRSDFSFGGLSQNIR